MARWGTFKWSDGTKWADGIGSITLFTAFIDRLAHRISIRLVKSTPGGATAAPTIQSIVAEVGPRAQNLSGFEAFIDRSEVTEYISCRFTQTGRDTILLTTEDGETLTTETGDPLAVIDSNPFIIDQTRILSNQRSRLQPAGSI